ncbi:antA/AntB antirepressor family protein [Bartonella sp. B23]
MNTLIKITEQTIGHDTVQTVNARELHAFLEVTSRFNDWIKNRIKEYDFLENQDFMSFTKNLVKPQGGRSFKDYALTLDMAKELAMVERNDKGKQARQYFIECERRAKQVSAPQIDYSDPRTILGVITHMQEELQNKDALIEQQAHKVIAYDHLTRAEGTMCITDTAKMLEIRPKDLFGYMQQKRWIYKRVGTSEFVPYQDKIQQGLMDCATNVFRRDDGSEKVSVQARVTAKGLAFLREEIHRGVQ